MAAVSKSVAQPSLDKDRNDARRQWMRNSQPQSKSEPKIAKNGALASLPHAAESQTPSKSRPKIAKNGPLASLPRAAERAPSKPYNKEQSMAAVSKTVAQPSLDKDRNDVRRQWMRNSQTPSKSEPKIAKNGPLASLP